MYFGFHKILLNFTSMSISFSLTVDIGPVVGFVHCATKYCECRARGWIHTGKLGGLLWFWLRTCLISWCAIFVCDPGFPVLKGSDRPLIREHLSNSSAFTRMTPGLMSLMNYFDCLKNLCQRYYQKWLNMMLWKCVVNKVWCQGSLYYYMDETFKGLLSNWTLDFLTPGGT